MFVDNEIVACVSEERFSRKKNDECYPLHSIEYVLKAGGISGKDLDSVVIAGKTLNLSTQLTRTYSSWKIPDHIKAMREFWYPTLYEGKEVNFYEIFKEKIDLEQYPGTWDKIFKDKKDYYSEVDWPIYRDFIHKIISDHIGISINKIKHMDHHVCHAAYAYWASPFRGKDVLVMTADAYGDGLSNTLSLPQNNGGLKCVHSVSDKEFTLARLYRYMTLLMGMEPNAHEYKVMGLAPYAKDPVLEGPYQVFKQHMYVDGIRFKYHEKPKDYYFWFKDRLEGFRFDGIAGGLQKYTEDIMVEYTRNAMKKFKAKRLVYSGGISMNVKVNMFLKDIDEVEDIFIPPSGGDESLAIGACYAYMDRQRGRDNMKPLENSYLGPDVNEIDIKEVTKEAKNEGYFICDANDDLIADILVKGLVIGRCCNRMEFGARALGNRSIIADPRNRSIVETINNKIKNRDFWMPFAPSILKEHSDKYIVNTKGISSPYMTVGFESTDEGEKMLEAGTHPADKTLRPHFVTEENNPAYHSLIKAFHEKTGVSGLLNTSFNLHGEPIVNTATDAYRVFKLTDIDAIILNNKIIAKKEIS